MTARPRPVLLVTTDGSRDSERILSHAARLAATTGAQATLLRVYRPLIDRVVRDPADPAGDERRQIEEWGNGLSALMERSGLAGQARVERATRGEDAGDAIVRVAREISADVIAMHSRGAGIARRVLLGSIAQDVLRKADVPVLMTGEYEGAASRAKGFRLVVTSDGSQASRSIAGPLAELFAGREIEATLLRVCGLESGRADPASEVRCAESSLTTLRELMPRGEALNERVEVRLPGETVAQAIERVAEEVGADLIAMATTGAGRVRQLLAGSTTLMLLGRSRRPLLLARGLTPGA